MGIKTQFTCNLNGLKGLLHSLQDFVWLLFYITIAPLPCNFLLYQANAIAVIIFHPLQLFLNSNGSNFNELKLNDTTQYFILAFCQAHFDKLTKFPILVKKHAVITSKSTSRHILETCVNPFVSQCTCTQIK